MNSINQARTVLSIAPCAAGFGFAFVREPAGLLNWGNKWITDGNKNEKALAAVEKMIERRGPGTIALPHASEKGSRRAKRIQKLVQDIAVIAKKHGVAVKFITQKELRNHFFVAKMGRNTKGRKSWHNDILKNWRICFHRSANRG